MSFLIISRIRVVPRTSITWTATKIDRYIEQIPARERAVAIFRSRINGAYFDVTTKRFEYKNKWQIPAISRICDIQFSGKVQWSKYGKGILLTFVVRELLLSREFETIYHERWFKRMPTFNSEMTNLAICLDVSYGVISNFLLRLHTNFNLRLHGNIKTNTSIYYVIASL